MTAEIRELLELAAQAAGYSVVGWMSLDKKTRMVDVSEGLSIYNGTANRIFKPLESGDDLIDLIDRLMMNINRWKDGVSAYIDEPYEGKEMLELYADHPTRKAALSMAVVRCAAEWQRRG